MSNNDKDVAEAFSTLETVFKTDDGKALIKKAKGLICFKLGSSTYLLDTRNPESPAIYRPNAANAPTDSPDVTLTMKEDEFLKLIRGKSNPQTSFLLGKLKMNGTMALALKLQPILQAAGGENPKSKL